MTSLFGGTKFNIIKERMTTTGTIIPKPNKQRMGIDPPLNYWDFIQAFISWQAFGILQRKMIATGKNRYFVLLFIWGGNLLLLFLFT